VSIHLTPLDPGAQPRGASISRSGTMLMLVLSAALGGLIAAGLLFGLRPTAVEAQPSRAAALQSDFITVADQVRPVVVNINTEQEIRRQVWGLDIFNFDPWSDNWPPFRPYTQTQKITSLGSGVIVSPDGYVLTNAHVVAGATKISVTLANERTYPARLVTASPGQDLAVVKIDASGPLPTARLGDADRVKVGSWAIAIGSPFGFNQTVTVGVISAKGRVIRQESGQAVMRDLLQTDAAINFGNSGGPLLNLDGEVIGINQAIFSPAGTGNIGIGFAIPINQPTKAAIEDAISSVRSRA